MQPIPALPNSNHLQVISPCKKRFPIRFSSALQCIAQLCRIIVHILLRRLANGGPGAAEVKYLENQMKSLMFINKFYYHFALFEYRLPVNFSCQITPARDVAYVRFY